MLHARGIFSCPDGTVSLALTLEPWHLSLQFVWRWAEEAQAFHVYILKEGMAKKIREGVDELFSFSPLPEVSSPWFGLASCMASTEKTLLSQENSFIKRNN